MPQPFTNIRIRQDDLLEFTRTRLRISAEVGWTIPAGEFVVIMSRLAENHITETVQIAEAIRSDP